MLSKEILALCVAGWMSASADACEAKLAFDHQTGDQTTCLVPTSPGYKVLTLCQQPGSRIRTEPDLAKVLAGADELVPLFALNTPNSRRLILLARTPSTHGRPTAFCGAGHEDFVLLLELTTTRAVLTDKYLLQSCLHNLSLVSDGGDAARDAISVDKPTGTLRWRWLGKPDQLATLSVTGTHLTIHRIPAAD